MSPNFSELRANTTAAAAQTRTILINGNPK